MVHALNVVVTSSILVIAFSLYVVHWFRRSLWQTTSSDGSSGSIATPSVGTSGIEGPGEETTTTTFDRVQRLFHWSVTLVTVALVASGLILYYPGYLAPLLTPIGIPVHSFFLGWVDTHVLGAAMLLGLIVIHIAWDSFKLRTTRLMVPGRRDVREAMRRAWRFVWGGSPTPRSSKYDVFMKSYHVLLIVCSLALGVTGFVQYTWAPWWLYPEIQHEQLEPWWRPTMLHDLFGFILIALVVGHVYFSILPTNRNLFYSMIKQRVRRAHNSSSTSTAS